MPVDYTKFPFPNVEAPHAATLTEAVRFEPSAAGFIVVTLKVGDVDTFLGTLRDFAHALWSTAAATGLDDITAYREIKVNELGGAVPFDQAICEKVLQDAQKRGADQSDRFPGAKMVGKLTSNPLADWVLLLEYRTTDQALAVAESWNGGEASFQTLLKQVKAHTVGAFKNTKQYAFVSRDPNVVQFFNLFAGPGDPELLWPAWQEALPWFLESGEIRSSFPLVSLKPGQPLLLVNYAHCDSMKHFLSGVAYDPNFLETITHCYADRGFKLPAPFLRDSLFLSQAPARSCSCNRAPDQSTGLANDWRAKAFFEIQARLLRSRGAHVRFASA